MKNNKGFSLVELIIVIAIMAVLVGVLAPTYMQYVEKSKKSNDVSTVDSIVNAFEIAAIDPETQGDTWTKISVKIGTDDMDLVPTGSENPTNLITAVTNIVPTSTKLKSSDWGAANYKVEIIVTKGANGKVTFSYGTDTASQKFKGYATSISKIS